MDSREPPPVPPQPSSHPLQPQPCMLMGPTSSYSTTAAHPTVISSDIAPTAVSTGFPFNSVSQRPELKLPSSDGGVGGLNASAFDGSPPSPAGMGFSIEPAKKKRGRPRKYTPDGNIALGLTPTPLSSGTSVGHGDSGDGTPRLASEPPLKRHRGRPPGSVKKQLDALGVGGVGFMPHVITVKAGEDIASKIMTFSQLGPRAVCILSATGAIRNVTLCQPAMSGGTVTYEGRFQIICLSGSFLLSENSGSHSRTGSLSVLLAGSDGRVLGGGVTGMLVAASPVQIIVGSFAEGKKSKSGPSSAPPQSRMLNFGAPLTTASPPSQGASGESSDENGGGSPPNRGPEVYGNAGQPIHNMQMYQLWATTQNP